jgi:hypothetical protein
VQLPKGSANQFKEADVSMTLLEVSTSRAALSAALSKSTAATYTTHAHATAGKFWATKNFAAYGRRGTWSSIR